MTMKYKATLLYLISIISNISSTQKDKNDTCEGNTCPSSYEVEEARARKREEKVLRELFSGSDITDWDWYGSTEKDRCLDKNEECPTWAELGECETNPRFMLQYCQTSCDACISSDDVGVDQSYGSAKQNEIKKVINQYHQYFANEVLIKGEYSMVRKDCKNHHQSCAYWVTAGECERNLAYMTENCPLACRTCLRLDYKVKCPVDMNTNALKEKGDLSRLFQSVIMESGDDVQPIIIHSKPTKDDNTIPWIVELNNFVSQNEANELINVGKGMGYDSSSGSWCTDQCSSNATIQSLLTKLSTMLNIPEKYFELFHLVKYDSNTMHSDRHDYHVSQLEKQYGVRVISIYLSLNDVPSTKGGKMFTISDTKDIVIRPKLGRVVIWSNVLDDDTFSTRNDEIILRGLSIREKNVNEFGVNIWVHNRDFRIAYTNGCA